MLADPGAARVQGLSRASVPVAPDDEFILATSSYRLSTLQVIAGAAPQRVVHASDRLGRDVLTDWFVAGNTPDATPPAEGWHLALPQGASATFESCPRLRLDGVRADGLHLTDLGLAETGFRRVRLSAPDA